MVTVLLDSVSSGRFKLSDELPCFLKYGLSYAPRADLNEPLRGGAALALSIDASIDSFKSIEEIEFVRFNYDIRLIYYVNLLLNNVEYINFE